jgi:hypothetical protein
LSLPRVFLSVKPYWDNHPIPPVGPSINPSYQSHATAHTPTPLTLPFLLPLPQPLPPLPPSAARRSTALTPSVPGLPPARRFAGLSPSLAPPPPSPVSVHEPDEITSNGGKDRSVTKEHPQELKRKRLNFMHGEPPSRTRG